MSRLIPQDPAPKAHRFRPWCKQVGVSPSSGYKAIKLGKIKTFTFLGCRMITEEESARVLAEGLL
jgi:predicted site-specific integrase-resolvase